MTVIYPARRYVAPAEEPFPPVKVPEREPARKPVRVPKPPRKPKPAKKPKPEPATVPA